MYGRTKPGTLLKHHIPIKTDHWDVTEPGFTEVDLVSHSGERADGDFLHSLDMTDIHTTWVETGAVMGKSQVRVQEALEQLRQQLPFALRGIDSDNGSEFINAHLHAYCQTRQIQFTRGRPYKKDDNAHVEQKNWTHVRKHMGYLRYDTEAARVAMNAVYADLRLLQNLFLPSVKLQSKERVGARLRRRYGPPQDAARSRPGVPAGRSRQSARARRAPHAARSVRPGGPHRREARTGLRARRVRAAPDRSRPVGARTPPPRPRRPPRPRTTTIKTPASFGNTIYGATTRRWVTPIYSTRHLT